MSSTNALHRRTGFPKAKLSPKGWIARASRPGLALVRLGAAGILLFSLAIQSAIPVFAAPALSVTPLTWNVVGLDSNNPLVGPNNFPVGARVCNAGPGPATNVAATFLWDDLLNKYTGNNYINLRTGSLDSLSTASIAAGSCYDFYFEVSVTRQPVSGTSYDKTRRYHIQATADGGVSVSSPTPREMYVEHLISQNRNSTTNVLLDGVSIPAGGTMSLMVGNAYTIQLVGSTATQGYNQIETFINFPNTIFQVLSVQTAYSADSSLPPTGYVPNPDTKLYGDACLWDNDPNSPTYRSCTGIDGKAGGNVTVTYQIRVISGGGTSQTLNNLIYDFSGSSYHYNADYAVGARIAAVVDPATVTIEKAFSPSTTTAGGNSTITFTLTNPNAVALGSVSFTDTFPTSPGAMVVATPAVYSTNGCGSPTFTPVAGAGSISFSNGTIGPNGTCTISVMVTAPTAGPPVYSNTTNDLFINGIDTGHTSNMATLTVNSAPAPPACTSGLELARWTMETSQGTTVPPAAIFRSSRVSSATAAFNNSLPSPAGSNIATVLLGAQPLNYWEGIGWLTSTGWPSPTTDTNFEFSVDSSNFTGVQISLLAYPLSNWANPNNNDIYFWSSANGGGYSQAATFANLSRTTWNTYGPISAVSTGTSTTSFRVAPRGRSGGASGPSADIYLDNIIITGCGVPTYPTVTKAFGTNPIAVGGTSILTFTFTNENNIALSGVSLTDVLPIGLQVAATPAASTTCTGAPTWAPAAGATTLTFGSPAGATIPARSGATNGSCTARVTVTATTAGPHNNVSGFVSFVSNGTTATNTGPGGSASASLTALAAPVIAKSFSPNPVQINTATTLTFTITNPNQNNSLTGVGFTDTFPTSPGNIVVAAPATYSNSGCGSPTYTPVADAGSISFSGGTIAGGGTCTVTVQVRSATAGSYTGANQNTSGNVSTVINSATVNGNTASAGLTVNPVYPSLSLLKQISTSTSGPWTTYQNLNAAPPSRSVYYRFTVENTGDVPMYAAAIPITDADSAVTAVMGGCSWTNPWTASTSLPVAVAANENHITSCVIGPVDILDSYSSEHTNTAIAHGTAPMGGTNYASDPSEADYATTGLTLDKTAASPYFSPGGTISYSYLVTNSGSAALAGPVTITDDLATATCPDVTSIVPDSDAFLDPGESLTCTATYPVPGIPNTVTNTAHASAGGVDSNDDTVTVNLRTADLGITKTDGTGTYIPDTNTTYTVTVTNAGPLAVTGATVTDTRPAEIDSWSWTCLGAGGATCSASGSGNISDTVNIPVGGTLTYTIVAHISAGATGGIDNTATVSPPSTTVDPNSANDSATDSDVPPTTADLGVTKTDGVLFYTPGGSTTYTVVVTNHGPQIAYSALVEDYLPASITSATWTCVGAGGAACPASGSGDIYYVSDIPAGGTLTYTITANISPAATGNLVNTATVTEAPATTDPDPGNDSATDTDTATPSANLSITKSDGVATYTPGSTTTYTVVVSNSGPSNVTGATVTDNFPAALTSHNWTCAAAGGAACAASGSGDISDTIDIPVWGTATYTVTANISAGATGDLVNTAIVDPSAGMNDTDLSNNTATDTDTAAPEANLGISKSDGVGTYTAGETVTYNITVANAGPSDVTGATVTDTFPAAITSASWACSPSGGAICAAPGSGDINDTVDIPAGDSVTYTVTVDISSAATGNLVNTATVTVPVGTTDPTPGNNSATDTDTAAPSSDLSITKTDGVATYTPGGSTTYVIVASNNGPSNVTGATVTDTFPAAITSHTWTCVAAGGASCTASGSGDISDTVNIPVGGTATYTVVASISASASGNLVNTATVAVPSGTTDPTPGNNSATDTDTAAPSANLAITKTDSAATYTPGGSTTYVIVASNNGPSNVTGATVTDTFPAALTSHNWTCAAAGGATCTASGSGNISDTINIPVGATATYTVVASISAGASGNLLNTATVAVPVGTTDPTPGNNSATDSDTVAALSSISGTVYDDLDASAARDAGEPGIGSVTITLLDSGGATVATTVTAANGSYSFTALPPGDYTVVETDPPAYVSTTANTVPVTVPVGSSAIADFGDYHLTGTVPASITGTVYNDFNGNGVREGGEPGIGGVTVDLLDGGNNVVGTTLTAANGTYSFINLTPGVYTVRETDPAGFISTTANLVSVVLGSGTTATVRFGDQTSGGANIADPALTKYGDPASARVGDIVTFTITVSNSGNASAANVVVTDTKPAFLDILTVSISPNPGLTVIPLANGFSINFGTVDPGDFYTILVVTRVNSLGLPPGGANNASLVTTSPTDRPFNNAGAANVSISITPSILPGTGFAPLRETLLPVQPPELRYAELGDLWLEIPKLGVRMPIVGIPVQRSGWDVSWLRDQAGWLNGTAFPTWSGNSVLTGHVYLPNGKPGPFINLPTLAWGNDVIVHLGGDRYIFQVRQVSQVLPTDLSVLRHEDRPLLTLLTCRGYDEKTDTYRYRVFARAILVRVEAETASSSSSSPLFDRILLSTRLGPSLPALFWQ